jgi:hypothetical protein
MFGLGALQLTISITHVIIKITDLRLQCQTSKRNQIVVGANDVILENRFPQLKEQSVARFDGDYSKGWEEEFDTKVE